MDDSLITKSMIENYISRREEDLNKLKVSLYNNSVAEFNRVGHQLLGNASSFGFTSLEEIAHELDCLKLTELKAKGPLLIAKFSEWIAHARSSLN